MRMTTSVHESCLVEIFKQYISLVSELLKIDESFYFRPSKTAYKFENAPIGIHKLNSIVPFLMNVAGLEVKTAYCLRVTTAKDLFRAGYQEKLISERTGHVSSAYSRTRSLIMINQWVYQSVLGRVQIKGCVGCWQLF